MKRIVAITGLFLVCQYTFALDLTKVSKTLYYECHGEFSAGLYRDRDSKVFQPAIFDVDKGPWELRLIPIRSASDLEKAPRYCQRQRAVRLLDAARSERFEKELPEFCFVEVYKVKGEQSLLGSHCFITQQSRIDKSNSSLNCSVGDEIFFDSDRSYGLDGRTHAGSAELPLTHFAVRKFVCQRLDR